MNQCQPHLSMMGTRECAVVHEQAMRILSEVGVRVESRRALSVFATKAAADPSSLTVDGSCVRFSADIVSWALRVAKRKVSFYKRPVLAADSPGTEQPELAFTLGTGCGTYFGVGVTNLYYQDPETDVLSKFNRENMATSVKLSHCLPGYDIVSTIGVLQDMPPSVADLYCTLEMIANTSKPLIVLISEDGLTTPCLELIDHLIPTNRTHPSVALYVNPITPLVINSETGDKVCEAVAHGIPLIYSAYGMLGATAPITPAGALSLHIAELLAGLVLCELLQEGAPVIFGFISVSFDMRNMMGLTSVQSTLLDVACSNMMHFYDLPHARCSGSGDGTNADVLTAGIYWMQHLSACLSQDGLLPFVGSVFDSKAFSPVATVMAQDIIRQIRGFCEGFSLQEKDFVLQDIKQVGSGGNYFTTDSTVTLHRKATCYSNIPNPILSDWAEAPKIPTTKSFLVQQTLKYIAAAKPPTDHDVIIEKGEHFIRSHTS